MKLYSIISYALIFKATDRKHLYLMINFPLKIKSKSKPVMKPKIFAISFLNEFDGKVRIFLSNFLKIASW